MDAAVAFKAGYFLAMESVRDIAEDCAPRGQYEKFNDYLFWERFIQMEKDFKKFKEEA